MPTSIQFNDGASATLTNGRPVPADRFTIWDPDYQDIGPSSVIVGTGVTGRFVFREDYCALTELQNVPDTSLEVALRLKKHLERGGTATVNTGDEDARAYTARLRPGTRVRIAPTNAQRRLYTVTIEWKNTAAAFMLCEY